jgi:Reeler domain
VFVDIQFNLSHDGAITQTVPSPYDIVSSSQVIGNGKKMTVEIKSLELGRPFLGFILQARTSSDPVIIDGRFHELEGGSENFALLNCMSPNTSVTHSNNSPKTSLSFEWEAPASYTGVLRFQ